MTPTTTPQTFDVETAVLDRYKSGASCVQPALCCPPIDYDDRYLDVLPREIIDKDYGCGDPSKSVGEGETVVDLGSGAGKICYILAQKVGPAGHVIGVDFNDQMLAVARRHHHGITRKIGYDNVRFAKGRIQDLALNLERVQNWLDRHPVRTIEDLAALDTESNRLRREEPLIGDDCVDVVVSNCVLNLVRQPDKQRLFAEIFRVLKRGGRAVISDIVCDEEPGPAIVNDPELWSGCIAGAFREDRFLRMFERAGFHGIEILDRPDEPWRTIEGIEFRSLSVRAFKGKQGPCLERNQAVIYTGPWKTVKDDDGHTYQRGRRMAVCDKTYGLLTDAAGPYHHQVVGVLPRHEVSLDDAAPFDCERNRFRDPREIKGEEFRETIQSQEGDCCGPGGCR